MPATTSSAGVRGATALAQVGRRPSGAGRAARSSLPLAVRGQRVEGDEGRGHHVLGQPLAQVRPQLREVDAPRPTT